MEKNVLLQQGWLSRLPEGFRATVLSSGHVQRFPKGTAIYLQGDEPGGIYGIIEGAVAITIAPGQTGPHIAHLATSGAWFGEGCFLTGEPRRVGLEAASESMLFYLPLDAMERMATDDAANIRRFGQIAILNIDLALHVIDDLLIPDVERRIAATLLRLLGRQSPGAVHVSQAELGRLANASRKVVNRTLGRLAERGLVRRGYTAIQIVEPQRLHEVASGDFATGD